MGYLFRKCLISTRLMGREVIGASGDSKFTEAWLSKVLSRNFGAVVFVASLNDMNEILALIL